MLRTGRKEQLPGRDVEGGPVNAQQESNGKFCSCQPGVQYRTGGVQFLMGSEEASDI